MSENTAPQTPPATGEEQEKTVKELQAELVSLGMPEEAAKAFTTKAPALATINTLKATHAQAKIERVASLEEKPNPKEESIERRVYDSKADQMMQKLEGQRKVRVLIPLEGKEQQGIVREEVVHGRRIYTYVGGAVETVILNGYKVLIPKGQYVEVPEQVADVIAEAQQQTSQAGRQFLIDRIDPETGRPVRDLLRG